MRKSDGQGRGYTLAVVNETQAEIVRRVFAGYLEGKGLKAIAKQLNREGVPSPEAGRRGTRSWAPSSLRAMLHHERYRGIYVHGKIKKVRRNGALVRTKADAAEVMTVEVPEWRIVDDATWFAVQEQFSRRVRGPSFKQRPRAKYPLTGIGSAGGAVARSGSR